MDFKERVSSTTREIHILQINIGKMCNLHCSHCHVEASPVRQEKMSRETFQKALQVYDKFDFDTLDITGGEPTIHPDILFFIDEAIKRSHHIILRSNLIGLSKNKALIEKLVKNKIEIVVSLPCYTPENVDKMRGKGSFSKIIESIKILNSYGYGKTLPLQLVYNPLGDFLPPEQSTLEKDYREHLQQYGIDFSHLLTITNLPIGNFKEDLIKKGRFDDYQRLLEENFNPDTCEQLMCRYQISVGYDGKVYDCDFNQMEKKRRLL